MNKAYISADAYLRDIWRLAAEIRGAGWKPDVLIGLWRGGAPAAISVHEFLRASGWKVSHLPLKCSSYTGIGQNGGEVEFFGGEAVFGGICPGEKVLVVDDIFDTGKTAVAIHSKMVGLGAEMRLACVYWKSLANQTDRSPDYFARSIVRTTRRRACASSRMRRIWSSSSGNAGGRTISDAVRRPAARASSTGLRP